jgi:hypothetical protein
VVFIKIKNLFQCLDFAIVHVRALNRTFLKFGLLKVLVLSNLVAEQFIISHR